MCLMHPEIEGWPPNKSRLYGGLPTSTLPQSPGQKHTHQLTARGSPICLVALCVASWWSLIPPGNPQRIDSWTPNVLSPEVTLQTAHHRHQQGTQMSLQLAPAAAAGCYTAAVVITLLLLLLLPGDIGGGAAGGGGWEQQLLLDCCYL